MKLVTTLAALGLCAALAGPARADTIYTYIGTGSPYPLSIRLDISNAAVASGSFDLSGAGGGPLSGDTAGLIQLSASSLFGAVTPSGLSYLNAFDLALTFDASGAVTTTSWVSHSEQNGEASLTGTDTSAFGTFGIDNPRFAACGPQNMCQVSGSWTFVDPPDAPVPEPASAAILGAGVLLLGAARRRAV